MFDIDRKYIDQPTLEDTLQSKIIYIRSKYKHHPTLPQPSAYGLTDDAFDEYIDRKQDLIEWQKYCKQKGLSIIGVLFCLPPVIASFYSRSDTMFYLSFLAGIILAAIPWLIFKMLSKHREKTLFDEAHEQYINALLDWEKKINETTEDL